MRNGFAGRGFIITKRDRDKVRANAVFPEEDEKALIERAKSDREAFGELYRRYVDRIYNYVYYRVGNQAEAEDLTARIFFRALQHIGRYEDQGAPFSAWLYRIARNLVANWHRDNSRRQIIGIDAIGQWPLGEITPELAAERTEDQAFLLAAVRRLPVERQELLILKFVERHSNAEIGAIMGRSEGAIKSLYHRTLRSLREAMQAETAPAEPDSKRRRFSLRRRRPEISE